MSRRTDNGPRKLNPRNLSSFAFKQQAQINILRESIYNSLRATNVDFVGLHIPDLREAVAKFGTSEHKRFLAFADAIWKAETALFDAQDYVR